MIKDILRPYYYRWVLFPKHDRTQSRLVEEIRERGYANVVFFAANLPMWRYQGIYELLKKDKRFRVTIILVPMWNYSEIQKEENIKTLKDYFNNKKIIYEDATAWPQNKFNIREWLAPDIMFYTQPGAAYNNALDNDFFRDKLLCFAPYGVGTVASDWSVNSYFQNTAWRLFYETEVYKEVAKNHTFNKGRNVVVVGNTNADEFLKPDHHYEWKPQDKPKKKVIWSPHFTIQKSQLLHRGSFLWLHDTMIRIAQDYSDKIQFVFKPHPRLRSVLNDFPEWGEVRTDAYYRLWKEMPNTQFENSSYIDLFMTSDAMIHDCASFTVEYHYSKKPCLFTSQSIEDTRLPLNEFGRAGLDAHYQGNSEKDVRNFLEEIVLEGDDPKQSEREAFFRKYLLPPNNKTVAQNIYDNIVQSIWG